MWPSESFSEGVASRVLSSKPDETPGEDDGEYDGENDGDHDGDHDGDDGTQRGMSVSFTNDIGSLLFMGNLALFAGLLVIIFSLHILVASAIEAHWLAKVRNGLRCKLESQLFPRQHSTSVQYHA